MHGDDKADLPEAELGFKCVRNDIYFFEVYVKIQRMRMTYRNLLEPLRKC